MSLMGQGLFWIFVMAALLVLEAITVGLTSIWFAAGALAALIVSFFTSSIWIQVACALAVAFLTLFTLRPVMLRRFVRPSGQETNLGRIVGSEAVVTEEIDNQKATGQVKVNGAVWTARSDGGQILPQGTAVRVERIEGVKLMVAPLPLAATGKKKEEA